MANTAQLLRRQSSRDIILKTQKSIDQHELRVSKHNGSYLFTHLLIDLL